MTFSFIKLFTWTSLKHRITTYSAADKRLTLTFILLAAARRAVQILAANSKQAASFQFVYYASSLRKQPIFYDAIVLDVFPAQRRLRYEPRNLYLGSASDWLKICLIFRGCLRGGRKILAPGRLQKADHPSAICFLRSVYMQRPRVVLVPRAMIRCWEVGRFVRRVNFFRYPSTRDKPGENGGGSLSQGNHGNW